MVLLPLSLPALAIVFLFNFLAAWGEYFTASLIIGSSEALLTWPLGIQRFQAQFTTQWSDLSGSVDHRVGAHRHPVRVHLQVPGLRSHPRRRQGVSSRLLTAGALLIVLAASPAGAASPQPSPAAPVRSALAVDGDIRQADLQHDSRSDLYRTPGGAVPAGTPVTLRIRAAAGDLGSAEVRVTDHASGTSGCCP